MNARKSGEILIVAAFIFGFVVISGTALVIGTTRAGISTADIECVEESGTDE